MKGNKKKITEEMVKRNLTEIHKDTLKSLSKREFLKLLGAGGAGAVLGLVSSGLVGASNPTAVTIEPGSFAETASYVIYTDGTYIYARNGLTGAIDFKGTDAATVIRLAINALPAQGGKVLIKAGTYIFTNSSLVFNTTGNFYEAIEVKDNITLEGEGNATVLQAQYQEQNYDDYLISAYGHTNYQIMNMKLDGSPLSAHVAHGQFGLDVSHSSNGLIENVQVFKFPWMELSFTSAQNIIVRNCILTGRGSADVLGGGLNTNCLIEDNIIIQTSDYGTYPTSFNQVNNTQVIVKDNIITGDLTLGSETGPWLNSKISGNIILPKADGTSGLLWAIRDDNQNVTFEGNVITNGQLSIHGSNHLITGNVVSTTYGSTFYCSNSVISGNVFLRTPTRSKQYIISVYGNSNRIVNNYINGYSNVYNWGIAFSSSPPAPGNGQYNLFAYNYVSGGSYGVQEISPANYNNILWNTFLNVDTPIYQQQANTVVKYNIGYVTENKGTATIAANTTSITVSHGLASTPSKVIVTPIGDPGTRYWVASVGATSFNIVLATAQTTAINFYWEAEV